MNKIQHKLVVSVTTSSLSSVPTRKGFLRPPGEFTCYIGSTLQLLKTLPGIVNFLIGRKRVVSQCLTAILKELDEKPHDKPIDLSVFKEVLDGASTKFHGNLQHDVHELFLEVCHIVDGELKEEWEADGYGKILDDTPLGCIKMLKSNVCDANRDHSVKGRDEINVEICQDDGFLPVSRCFVNSNNAAHVPVCYYAHVDGFIISVRRNWSRDSISVRRKMEAGTHDILGRLMHTRKNGKNGMKYLTRNYSVMKATTCKNHGYQRVSLADKLAQGHQCPMSVGVLVLSAFVCDRPCVDGEYWTLEHGAGVDNNSLESICWLPRLQQNDAAHKCRM